ncbi:MAG: hypothetical protein VW405_01660 [Rhodospirillaceae bacterium]
MTLTLSDARTIVADYLDDANNIRWSTTQIDTALDSAIDRCVQDYVADGGERFTEEVNVSSSASDGSVDLSTYDPLHIAGVRVKVGEIYYPVHAVKRGKIERADNVARDLYIQIVRRPDSPVATDDLLVSYQSGGADVSMGAHLAFDHWVCVRAAIQLSSKDAEQRDDLKAIEADHRRSVLGQNTIPAATRFPRRRGWVASFLRWSWEPKTQYLYVSQAVE